MRGAKRAKDGDRTIVPDLEALSFPEVEDRSDAFPNSVRQPYEEESF